MQLLKCQDSFSSSLTISVENISKQQKLAADKVDRDFNKEKLPVSTLLHLS